MSMEDFELSRHLRRGYKKYYRELMKFIETASIPQIKYIINEYLRAENLVLKQLYRVKFGKIRLTRDEKIILAKKAIKFRKWHTNAISVLSPAQIIRYANFCTAQTHVSLGPTRTPKKETTALEYQIELLEIIDKHSNWGKAQILKEIRKTHPSVDRIYIYDLLMKIGFWDARKPKQTIPWKEWVKRHEGVTWGGDFFSVYVWTEEALVQFDILFFIHLETLRVVIAGISDNATEEWLINILKNWTDGFCPLGPDAKFLIRDRDRRYTKNVDWYFAAMGIMPKKIAAGAPVMNCVSEQFVNNIRRDLLSHCVFLNEDSLRKVIALYVDYYHKNRPNKKHNGGYIMPQPIEKKKNGHLKHIQLIDGLLSTYCYEA